MLPSLLSLSVLGCSSGYLREQAKDLEEVYGMQLVRSGTYTIGCTEGQEDRCTDAEPLREVTLTQPYLIGETEVTQELYVSIMDRNPSLDTTCGERCPVEGVSWYDAVRFANEVSAAHGLPQCYSIDDTLVELTRGLHCGGFRLPTEAEWEVAARGGQDLMYSGSNNAHDVAWFGEHPLGGIHPVGRKQPNAYGLYDMSGNVLEWAWDTYREDPPSAANDPVVEDGTRRVVRGGNWRNDHTIVRVSTRYGRNPESGGAVSGLRLVLAAPPVE